MQLKIYRFTGNKISFGNLPLLFSLLQELCLAVQGSEDGFISSSLALFFEQQFLLRAISVFFLLLPLLDHPILILPLCFSMHCSFIKGNFLKVLQEKQMEIGDTISQVTFSRAFLFEWNLCKLALHLYLFSIVSHLLLPVNNTLFFVQSQKHEKQRHNVI